MIGLSANAEVIAADSAQTVRTAIEAGQDGTVALFFIDSTLTEGSDSGFWNNMVNGVTHLFNADDQGNSQQQQIDAIERDISQEVALVTIDVSNDELREIQESYDVTTVPFLIVFKRGIIVLKEVPTHETHDKILQVLNVNPAAVHAEEQPVTTTEETSSVIETGLTDLYNTFFGRDDDVVEVTTVETTVTTYEDEPVIVAPVQSFNTRPVNIRDARHYTLAPGEREKREQAPEQHVDPDDRRKFVHHQCQDVTTYDDEAAKHWRTSPFYISELEDYEIPEDWWRNGYTPITDPSRQERRTPEVAPVPVALRPQYVNERPIVEPVRPFVVEPVRPKFVEPVRPQFVEPVRPQVVYEPRTQPRSYVAQQFGSVVVTNTTTNYTAPSVRQVVSPVSVPVVGARHTIPTAPHVHVVDSREYVAPVAARNTSVVDSNRTAAPVRNSYTSGPSIVSAGPTHAVHSAGPAHSVHSAPSNTVRTSGVAGTSTVSPLRGSVRPAGTTASTVRTASGPTVSSTSSGSTPVRTAPTASTTNTTRTGAPTARPTTVSVGSRA